MSCYEYDQTAQLYEELYDKHGRLKSDLRKLVEEWRLHADGNWLNYAIGEQDVYRECLEAVENLLGVK